MRKKLPKWLNKLIPSFYWERLCRKQVDQLRLTPFCKWEGLYFCWGPQGEESTGYLIIVREVKEQEPTALAPA